MPLGKRTDCGDAKYAGVEVSFACDVVEALEGTLQCGFDFLAVPLVHPRFRRPRLEPGVTVPPFTRSDLLLTSSQWSSQIVGKVSPWIEPDAPSAPLRRDSEAALRQELEWAAHLSLQACILPLPHTLALANYARILHQVMLGLSSMALWIRIPLAAPAAERSASRAAEPQEGAHAPADPWEWWYRVRCLCGQNAKLGVLLDLPLTLPPQQAIDRWRGEPVRAVALPTAAFVANRRGYPTLPRAHQELLIDFWWQGVQVILTGQAHHAPPAHAETGGPSASGSGGSAVAVAINGGAGPGVAAAGGESDHPLRAYCEYLSYIFRKAPLPPEQELLELSYRDYLQAPLQPLQDNLESQTYETFEKDSTKYSQYQAAVHAALLDRPLASGAAEGDEATVLMVVGAGRGPLVRASLAAADAAGRRLRVYAVEKNANAVVTLQNLVESEGWGDRVTVAPADMRSWAAPELADILVSELLGSFGDNELSPECLDGAQRFLKPGGVSIPAAYTSFLQPVTSSKLWTDVKAYNDREHLETPYVVKLHRFTTLAPTQPVFTFEHPNPAAGTAAGPDNTRETPLRFERPGAPAAVCHGFAGYFDAQLYGDVRLSTHPPSHTPAMFSWFPIFFPLRRPLHLPAGAPVQAHIWRCCSNHKVWYEWAVVSPTPTPIHNPNGRSYYVGL
ncbi:hypothetical protein WJX81_000077 [Elliptochloris bilobata]|uniref:Protein arginine N-methyltransferase n=1 Tax=Elliptochloris bilobata TaxID=381761 RepID=A0AAW1RKS6_9CHLO